MTSYYKYQGKKVNEVADILYYEYDVIFLAVSDDDMVREIKKELIGMGVDEKKSIGKC